MTPDVSRKSRFSLFFVPELRAGQGRMALPVVFWGYGVAMSMALAILHATALDAGQLAFQQVLILISAPVASGYWSRSDAARRTPVRSGALWRDD